MADFDQAYDAKIPPNEGGYDNDPNDRGGETYRGLCRKYDGDWPGWKIVDEVKAATPLPPASALPNGSGPGKVYGQALQYRLWMRELNATLAARADLQTLCRDWYRLGYWRYAKLNDQEVAAKIFDLGVYSGMKEAVKLAQRAARYQGKNLNIDGAWGPVTEAAINACDPIPLLNDLRHLAEEHSQGIVACDPTQRKFLKDWLARDAQ